MGKTAWICAALVMLTACERADDPVLLSQLEEEPGTLETRDLATPKDERRDGFMSRLIDRAVLNGAVEPSEAQAELSERAGLFAGLFGKSESVPTTEAQSPVDETSSEAVEAVPPRTGLFAGLLQTNAGQPTGPRRRSDPGFTDVSFGETLPYGQVARLCDVPNRRLGRVVAQYPDRGAARYRIHDPDPDSQIARTMYVTGFGDGCARQFTAALALFGTFELHERLRYGLPADTLPYSETDQAYERLKSRECGVRRNRPCGAGLSRFARTGAFVSLYERYEGSVTWKNLLLHDGRVVAFDVKGRD